MFLYYCGKGPRLCRKQYWATWSAYFTQQVYFWLPFWIELKFQAQIKTISVTMKTYSTDFIFNPQRNPTKRKKSRALLPQLLPSLQYSSERKHHVAHPKMHFRGEKRERRILLSCKFSIISWILMLSIIKCCQARILKGFCIPWWTEHSWNRSTAPLVTQLQESKAENGKPKLHPSIVGNISLWDWSY